MIDCSGVRSSWLMLAMNSLLAREASSAASRASRVARSAPRSSLTSMKVDRMPAGARRRAPGTTTLLISRSRREPSRWLMRDS
jgi:hypothetical protein